MSNRFSVVSFSCADEALVAAARARAKSQGFTFSKFMVGLLLKEMGWNWSDLNTPRMGAPPKYSAAQLNEKSNLESAHAAHLQTLAGKGKPVSYRKRALRKSAALKHPAQA